MSNDETTPPREATVDDDDPLFTPEQHRTRQQVKELRQRSAELIARSAQATRSKELRHRFPLPTPPDAPPPPPLIPDEPSANAHPN